MLIFFNPQPNLHPRGKALSLIISPWGNKEGGKMKSNEELQIGQNESCTL
jgi:hypothetical protein